MYFKGRGVPVNEQVAGTLFKWASDLGDQRAFGLAQAVSVEVGQALGASRPEAAEQAPWAGLQLGWMYVLLIALSFAAIPEFYLSWFENDGNPVQWRQVAEIAPRLLLFIGGFVAFDCMNLVFSLALKGAGDTRFVSLLALVLPWPIMVLPTSLLVEVPDGLYWSWAAASAYIVIQATVFWRRFVGGKWKTLRVISPSADTKA